MTQLGNGIAENYKDCRPHNIKTLKEYQNYWFALYTQSLQLVLLSKVSCLDSNCDVSWTQRWRVCLTASEASHEEKFPVQELANQNWPHSQIICFSALTHYTRWFTQWSTAPAHYLWTSGICVAGPTVWNSLPEDLQDPDVSEDSYRQSLKTFLFSQY